MRFCPAHLNCSPAFLAKSNGWKFKAFKKDGKWQGENLIYGKFIDELLSQFTLFIRCGDFDGADRHGFCCHSAEYLIGGGFKGDCRFKYEKFACLF